MLQIALPNKGSLSEDAIELVKEAGYRCKRYHKELVARDPDNNIEFIFLRPRDIAVYVANGVLDLGITGRDLAFDSRSGVKELATLRFGGSKFFYAVPKDSDMTPDDFGGKRIATSYPNIVLDDMENRGLDAKVIKLNGAVEISVQLGVADAIADVVSSGKTLQMAGLKIVGEPIMKSEAVLVARDEKITENSDVNLFIKRLQGIVTAREYAIVEYDISEANLDKACEVTPGIESPTVSPLMEKKWFAVKAMIKRKEINTVIDNLSALEAKGIIVTDIRTCRI